MAAGDSRPSGLGPGLGAIVREGRRDPGCWEELPCAARGGHWSGVGRRAGVGEEGATKTPKVVVFAALPAPARASGTLKLSFHR